MRLALLALLAGVPFARADSNGLLAVRPDGSLLLAANTDAGTVSVVDLRARRQVHEIPAGDHPEGTAWAGQVGLAAVYGDDTLLFLDPVAGKVSHTLKVDDEPYGVVATRDGRTAYVTHDDPGTVSVIDVPGRRVARTFKVGSGCRGVALSPDEKTLYVSEFFTAHLLAVDAATGTVTDRWEAFGSDNLARNVVLHPHRPKAYLAHIRSRVTAFDARGSIFPQLSICDLWAKPAGGKRRRSIALDTFNGVLITTNPWEAAFSPDVAKLYVVYSGTDDMNVCKVFDDDYTEVEAVGRPVPVGKHPRAVRVSPDGREVYVFNTLQPEVRVLSDDLRRTLARIPVGTPARTPEWRRGKELFQLGAQPMTGARWIACSSCHPDGLSDGRVWQNPEGPRRTPNLFGLAHTHPLHWSADRDEVQDFEYTIRGKLMQGRGLLKGPLAPRKGFLPAAELDETTADRSPDLDALAVYCNSFPVRLSPHNPAPGKLSAEAERGKALFFAAETKCATCHSGPYYTDGRRAKPFLVHDVGTGGGPAEKMGPAFDTPTLLGVYRNPSWLHDGRAKSLRDVLTVHNAGDKHGVTSHLKPAEVDELVAFLRALPYEPPPDETANTVRHRVRTEGERGRRGEGER